MVKFQGDKSEHLRHILLYEFNKGAKASEAARNICAVYGTSAITDRTAQRWFNQLESNNFNLTDAPRCGRPQTFDEQRLNELIRGNPNQSSRTLAKQLGCNNATVTRHLKIIRSNQRPNLKSSVGKKCKTQPTTSTPIKSSNLPSSKLQSSTNVEDNNLLPNEFVDIPEILRYYPY